MTYTKLISHGEITLTWNDGRTVKMGSIDISGDDVRMKKLRHVRQRIGWELVRIGFRMILPKRNWETKYE